MKEKDDEWYENKVQEIKKKKRSLKDISIEPILKKKIVKDLKTEQRSAKHSSKNHLKEKIKDEIDKYFLGEVEDED